MLVLQPAASSRYSLAERFAETGLTPFKKKKSSAVCGATGFGGFALVSGQNDSSKINFPPDQVQDFKVRFRSERCRKSFFFLFFF